MCFQRAALHLLYVLILAFGWPARAGAQVDAQTGSHGSGGVNVPTQIDKPYVVLVSIDGFRWDYPDLFETPALNAIAASGVRAESLVPVWPTLTFPNHYTLATGDYPARHDLVANHFFSRPLNRWYDFHDRPNVEDPVFYGAEPIWVTAESQGMVSSVVFWVGSEAPIKGIQATHWRPFDAHVTAEQRVDEALSWLARPAASRPHFNAIYFDEVDSYSHWAGIGSEPMRAAVRHVDTSLARLEKGIKALPFHDRVTLIVVSDHGQMPFRAGPAFVLSNTISLNGLKLADGGSYVYAWQSRPDPVAARALAEKVNAAWQHGRAYTRDSAPAGWRLDGNPRFPDLIFQASPGFAVASVPANARIQKKAGHGWTPDTPEMQGIFFASGPDISAGQRIGAVRNVDVYPLLCRLLQLHPAPGIDGGSSLADRILSHQANPPAH